MSWDGDAEVVKIVYLVGDAPPHTDYQDGFGYERAASAAAAQGHPGAHHPLRRRRRDRDASGGRSPGSGAGSS